MQSNFYKINPGILMTGVTILVHEFIYVSVMVRKMDPTQGNVLAMPLSTSVLCDVGLIMLTMNLVQLSTC